MKAFNEQFYDNGRLRERELIQCKERVYNGEYPSFWVWLKGKVL